MLPAVDPIRSILVVEDDPLLGWTIRTLLRRAGFAVDLQTTGSRAIERLRASPYALVITDLRLPGADGFQVTLAARMQNPVPPVCIITTYANDVVRRQAEDLHVSAFIEKPFDVDVLLEWVEHEMADAGGSSCPMHGATSRR
jgi:DNA-binding response OmpR family regulator